MEKRSVTSTSVKARWREGLTVALLVVRARQPHVAHLDVGAHHLGRAALARTVHPRRAEWRELSVRFLGLLKHEEGDAFSFGEASNPKTEWHSLTRNARVASRARVRFR